MKKWILFLIVGFTCFTGCQTADKMESNITIKGVVTPPNHFDTVEVSVEVKRKW